MAPVRPPRPSHKLLPTYLLQVRPARKADPMRAYVPTDRAAACGLPPRGACFLPLIGIRILHHHLSLPFPGGPACPRVRRLLWRYLSCGLPAFLSFPFLQHGTRAGTHSLTGCSLIDTYRTVTPLTYLLTYSTFPFPLSPFPPPRAADRHEGLHVPYMRAACR
ncbi:hypothetical protein GGR56DRAFT_659731 [Xylariaceae sp. FL0804]|nr:hypothetical protein GGR56DRAFT_659731 [Xylariaceae sp. FL0804]